MIEKIIDNVLFKGLKRQEIETCLNCSNAKIKEYNKNQIIFSQMEPPKALYVLLEGSVSVCRDSLDGRRYILTNIEEKDIFGEVFVFLERVDYNYYVIANLSSKILEIPKEYFFSTCDKSCKPHSVIIQNMLGILAQKAYYLNNKVQLLTIGNLRQKIVKFLLDQSKGNIVELNMNREQFADYLNVARPSLSRELIHMQEEGLITIDRKRITITDMEALSFEI